MIVKLINKIYQTGELPADFLANIFIPIPKTSNTTKCEEHQTISLISHACKILLYIIKNRITKIINELLEESQFGFREGSGTRNAVLRAKNHWRKNDAEKEESVHLFHRLCKGI